MQREKNIVRILLYAPLKKLIKITILNVEKLVFSWDAIIDSQLLLDESFVESSWWINGGEIVKDLISY